MTAPIRVGVVCDYPEEGWASMDLTGEMILTRLQADHADAVSASRVCPSFRRRFERLPAVGRRGTARNADRLVNRLIDYPGVVRSLVRSKTFDVFHLADHSYSQLVHEIPPGRAVVTCHDLDTFRAVLEPDRDPRPRWYRAMAAHILAGFKKAAAVACNSETTRDELLAHRLFPADRLHVIPMGTHPSCTPDPDPASDSEAARLVQPIRGPIILHVGSNIPRKRIDVLLNAFALIRQARPDARLVKVGGRFPSEFTDLAASLDLTDSITTLPHLTRPVLAAVYRLASVVLITSDAEGFGLPAVEALACGTPLIASDLPALREVASDAALYCPVADPTSFASAAVRLISGRPDPERRERGFARAGPYTWARHAELLIPIYRGLASR